MPPRSVVELFKVGLDISQFSTGLNQAMELVKKFANTIKFAVQSILRATQKVIAAFKRVGQSLRLLVGESARLDSMRDSFNKMAASFGATGQELLAAMNEATLGMARNVDLIGSAMTAMMLVNKEALGDVTKTIPMFAKIATAAARALGQEVSYMFESITRGIGRAEPKILDNLGFTIKLTEVYGDYAEELGKTVKELTIVEKQTALVNIVMRLGGEYVEDLGISTGGLATKQKQLHKQMEELKDVIGQAFMPLMQALQGVYADLANTVISKLVPALRMLGRVFSEVFGIKNPFMRWIAGDPIGKTVERIKELEGYLVELGEKGPDFIGEISKAWDEFNEEIEELNEKFAPRFAKIQSDLARRIKNIWIDYNLRKVRRDEDAQREEARRIEDHKERLLEIENRYTEDIQDAIRKRDARSLLNLMRRQKESLTQTESAFDKESDRRQQDRTKEERRAEEDAKRRVVLAKESAATQSASVQEAYDKALTKLEETRDKAVKAAGAAWESEMKSVRERIAKQKFLMLKQMQEQAAMYKEMSKPLPPFYEKLSEILSVVWEWLQKIRDIILAFISGDENVLDNVGLSSEKIEGIKNTLVGVWVWLGRIVDILSALWERAEKVLTPEITRFLQVITLLLKDPAFKEFADFLGVFVVTAVLVFIDVLGTVIRALTNLYILVGMVSKRIQKTMDNLSGIKKLISGYGKIIVGLMDGINEKVLAGLAIFVAGVIELFDKLTAQLIELVIDLFDRLIGHSIISDGWNAILNSVSDFMGDLLLRWGEGWDRLVQKVRDIWETIIGVIRDITSSITQLLSGWVFDVGGIISGLLTPIETVLNRMSNLGSLWGGGGSTSFSADNWNIYGDGAGEGVADQVYGVIADVVGGVSSVYADWLRP